MITIQLAVGSASMSQNSSTYDTIALSKAVFKGRMPSKTLSTLATTGAATTGEINLLPFVLVVTSDYFKALFLLASDCSDH